MGQKENILKDLQSEFSTVQVQIKSSLQKEKKRDKKKKEKKKKNKQKHLKKYVSTYAGFIPLLNHKNISLLILSYLSRKCQVRKIARLSTQTRSFAYSADSWKVINIDKARGDPTIYDKLLKFIETHSLAIHTLNLESLCHQNSTQKIRKILALLSKNLINIQFPEEIKCQLSDISFPKLKQLENIDLKLCLQFPAGNLPNIETLQLKIQEQGTLDLMHFNNLLNLSLNFDQKSQEIQQGSVRVSKPLLAKIPFGRLISLSITFNNEAFLLSYFSSITSIFRECISLTHLTLNKSHGKDYQFDGVPSFLKITALNPQQIRMRSLKFIKVWDVLSAELTTSIIQANSLTLQEMQFRLHDKDTTNLSVKNMSQLIKLKINGIVKYESKIIDRIEEKNDSLEAQMQQRLCNQTFTVQNCESLHYLSSELPLTIIGELLSLKDAFLDYIPIDNHPSLQQYRFQGQIQSQVMKFKQLKQLKLFFSLGSTGLIDLKELQNLENLSLTLNSQQSVAINLDHQSNSQLHSVYIYTACQLKQHDLNLNYILSFPKLINASIYSEISRKELKELKLLKFSMLQRLELIQLNPSHENSYEKLVFSHNQHLRIITLKFLRIGKLVFKQNPLLEQIFLTMNFQTKLCIKNCERTGEIHINNFSHEEMLYNIPQTQTRLRKFKYYNNTKKQQEWISWKKHGQIQANEKYSEAKIRFQSYIDKELSWLNRVIREQNKYN